MEEMLVYLVGAGVVLAAPLVPGLRPVIKSVVKGGLIAAEATRNAAVLVSQTWRDIVKQATEEFEAETRQDTVASFARVSTSGVVIDGEASAVGPVIDASPSPVGVPAN